MAANETDNSNTPVRPSWETAAPAARPPAPRQAAPRPAAPAYTPPPAAYTPPPAAVAAAPASSHYSEPLSDPNVRYDLAGNPIVTSTPAPAPYAPPAPYGYSAGPMPAAPGVWPPPPSTPYGGAWQGSENGTDRVARLKWNWGAFLIPLWWCWSHGQRGLAGAIVLTNLGDRYVPAPYGYVFSVIHLGIMIYLGIMGHRLAWSSERFAGDYDNFIRTQRAWMIWGFALTALVVIALVAAFTLLPGMINSVLGTPHTSGHYGSNHYGSGNDGFGSSSNPSSSGQ